jgi:DNA cross-link repair 1A protein
MCKPPLFLFGTYTIGKERIFLRAAQLFGKPLYADAAKRALLKVAGVSPAKLTSKPLQTNFHVVSMGNLSVASAYRSR